MPSLYALTLFLHVCGDIGIFIGIGIQLINLALLHRARSVEQVNTTVWLISLSDRVTVTSALVTIASGLYMAVTVWGLLHGWIAVALGTLIAIIAPIIRVVIEPRMRVIMTMTQGMQEGELPMALRAHIDDPVLTAALRTLVAVVFGVVFLMTVKPSLVGSVLAIAVFLVLGLASSLPLVRARPNSA